MVFSSTVFSVGESPDKAVGVKDKAIIVPEAEKDDYKLEPIGVLISRWRSDDDSSSEDDYTISCPYKGKEKAFVGYDQLKTEGFEFAFDNANLEFLFEPVDGQEIYKLQVDYLYRLPSNMDIVGGSKYLFYTLDEQKYQAVIKLEPETAKVDSRIKVINDSFGEYEEFQWFIDGKKVKKDKESFYMKESKVVTKRIKLQVWDDGDKKSEDSARAKWTNSGSSGGSSGGSGGDGAIVFNPNSSMQAPGNNLGWKNTPINVRVTIGGDLQVDVEGTQSRSYTYEEEIEPEDEDDDPEIVEHNESTDCGVVAHLEVGNISVSSAASGSFSGLGGGQVTVSREGEFNKLSGKLLEWKIKSVEWEGESAPNGGEWDSGEPSQSGIEKPELYTGESEYYKIDLTKPTLMASPMGRNWTNIPYTVSVNFMDNLSGIDAQSNITVSDSSYYANSLGMIKPNCSISNNKGNLNTSTTVSISQNGMYSMNAFAKDIATNSYSQTFGIYKFDNVNPDIVRFDISGFDKVIERDIPSIGSGFQYMSDQNNQLRVTVGDDLSGVAESRYSITQSSAFPNTSSMQALGALTSEGSRTSTSVVIDVNSRSSKIDDLREGLWYVHVYTRDRAGNETRTTSKPLFFNKIRTVLMNHITDYNWKGYTSFPVNDLPVWKNDKDKAVRLGYKFHASLNTIGFDEDGDSISIQARFFVLRDGNLAPVDLYCKDKNGGKIKKLDTSAYSDAVFRSLTKSSSIGSKQNVYEFDYFVPPHSLVVNLGETPEMDYSNVYKDKKDVLLVVLDITGQKLYNQSFDYTLKEDKFGIGSGSSYGTNNPSGQNLLGYGSNNGEFIYYLIKGTSLDDIDIFREW